LNRALKPIVLCADDYAIAPGVSRAILALIDDGRLSATSCLAVSPFWPEHADWLRARAARADIGLHLALTDLRPLGSMPLLAPGGKLPPLRRLLRIALAGGLDRDEIAAEIDRQIDRFAVALGRPPDFIDGHLHVHQLPTVRDIVVDRLRGMPSAYLRVCDEPLAAILRRGTAAARAAVISLLGRGLRRRAVRLGIAANCRFAGVRSFAERQPYRELFRGFIAGAPDGLLVMCHPGTADKALADVDPVTHPREDEYRYLGSKECLDDLAQAGVTPARFSAAPGR
jgi:predicted glycoside hydrolase/deacetylase ChbG (UPF0249 family)